MNWAYYLLRPHYSCVQIRIENAPFFFSIFVTGKVMFFTRSGHMIRNQPCWHASWTEEIPKQRKVKQCCCCRCCCCFYCHYLAFYQALHWQLILQYFFCQIFLWHLRNTTNLSRIPTKNSANSRSWWAKIQQMYEHVHPQLRSGAIVWTHWSEIRERSIAIIMINTEFNSVWRFVVIFLKIRISVILLTQCKLVIIRRANEAQFDPAISNSQGNEKSFKISGVRNIASNK